ncbi:MAG TPA: hypothetical protein VMD47_04825 [Candidatus Acidoferrales bacterium]|nr:hypothetical protein [Candidatus Acidoferrales bacterium]
MNVAAIHHVPAQTHTETVQTPPGPQAQGVQLTTDPKPPQTGANPPAQAKNVAFATTHQRTGSRVDQTR